ncbi:MAG TPA: 50S ribosomal protein L30e [Archaeoglobaceae archaeon]|nr:50S ribosomal protein L30e [Archaeoglobaceae archaeon]
MRVEIEKALRKALKTGKVYLGSSRTIKALRNSEAKLVLIASNCPEEVKNEIMKYNTPLIEFAGNNMELGAICGKPFSVASLAIIEAGESEILNAVES